MDINQKNIIYDKWLVFFSLSLFSILSASSLVGQKPIKIYFLVISSGTLLFSFAYWIVALITILYGYKAARNIINITTLCDFFITGIIYFSLQLPNPEFWNDHEAYSLVMNKIIYISFISTVSYYVCEMLNATILFYLCNKFYNVINLYYCVFISTSIAIILDTSFMIPVMLKSSQTTLLVIQKFISIIMSKLFFECCLILLLPYLCYYIINNINAKNIKKCSSVFWLQEALDGK
tara:strand:- start:2381 stop:3085 length:705 start_codon:yes stop_codon:yes gene_type:complete